MGRWVVDMWIYGCVDMWMCGYCGFMGPGHAVWISEGLNMGRWIRGAWSDHLGLCWEEARAVGRILTAFAISGKASHLYDPSLANPCPFFSLAF